MAITKIIENKGDLTTSSNNGKITINQTTGEIIVRNDGKKVVEINDEGFKYVDDNNTTRISMGKNTNGQQQIIIYGADGKAQILVCQDPKNGTPVVAVSDSGKDVLTELLNA